MISHSVIYGLIKKSSRIHGVPFVVMLMQFHAVTFRILHQVSPKALKEFQQALEDTASGAKDTQSLAQQFDKTRDDFLLAESRRNPVVAVH